MNIFVVFASGQVDVSIIQCISGAGSLSLVGHSKDTQLALDQIIESKAQLVMVDSRNAVNDAQTLLQMLREKASDLSTFVILGTVPMLRYESTKSGKLIYYFKFPEEEKRLRTLLGALEKQNVRTDQDNYISRFQTGN